MTEPPVALTIAGSDSGGGAGLQADLRCFAALGVHGTCAVTAVTAQDTVGIASTHRIPTEVVDAQIAAVVGDLAPRAAKTGMLATAKVMEVVARYAAEGAFPFLVVDPVMVASTGSDLLDADARQAYLRLLFPLATVVTPNLAEAALLVGQPVTSLEDMAGAARQLQRTGAQVVVITGGHIGGPDSIDVAFDGHNVTHLKAPKIDTVNLHGTGCSFSAAITAHLAAGVETLEAVAAAKRFVAAAIEGARAWSLGAGAGPLDQLGWTR